MHGGSRWIPGEAGMVFMMHLNEQVGHDYPGKRRAISARSSASCRPIPALTCFWPTWAAASAFTSSCRRSRRAFSLVYYDLAAVPFLYSDALYRYAAAFLKTRLFSGPTSPPHAQPLQAGNRRPRQRRGRENTVGQRGAPPWSLIGTKGTGKAFTKAPTRRTVSSGGFPA